MLVCHVSQPARRAAIVADIVEAAAASDMTTHGHVVFAALVDDPTNVLDHVDAFNGQIMLEAASAASTVSAGLAYGAAIVEAATAADVPNASVPIVGAIAEAASAADTPGATIIAGVSYVTWDPATVTAVTLSGGNLVATNTGAGSTNQGAHVVTTSGKTSGKYYFEATFGTDIDGAANSRSVGIGTTASTYSGLGGSNGTTGVMFFVSRASNNVGANGSAVAVAIPVPATVIGMAVDLDNRKMWFRTTGGIWNNSGSNDPATNVGGITIPSGTMIPFCTFGGTFGAAGNSFTANFGASTFGGSVPSGFTSGWPN